MDVAKLKKEIKETIFPNGEKRIKASSHQSMLFGLVDEIDRSDGLMRADIALNQEMAMENRDNINDLRDETTEKFGKVDTSISNINIREAETTKELDNIKNALRDVTSGKDNGQVTGGKVINIPAQATNSVAGYAFEGLTATQLVQNGDFKEGVTGFNRFNCEVRKVTDGVVFQANKQWGWFRQQIAASEKDSIYFAIKLNKPATFVLHMNAGSSNALIENDIFGSRIRQYTSGGWGITDSATENWDAIYIKYIVAYNLTANFGAGNEPTKEWCDEHFPEYFDLTKSVKTPLRLSCGDSKLFINSELELKKGDFIKNGVLNGKKLNTSGTLVTKADSKVVVDYAKNTTLLYQKGLKVDDIKTLDILQKFEADGSITSLDVEKATYTSKVLTHPELKDLDVCYVEYIYDTGIYGNNTITYGIDKFITNAPLISPDGRKWRKIEVATNDGILTTKLEEVK